jgi:hypothetical protein
MKVAAKANSPSHSQFVDIRTIILIFIYTRILYPKDNNQEVDPKPLLVLAKHISTCAQRSSLRQRPLKSDASLLMHW